MDNKKSIWIVNYYTTPPEYVSNQRHIKFATYLTQIGYDVTIICAGFLRDGKIDLVPNGYKYIHTEYDGLKYIHISVKHYSGNGVGRMISIFQFSYRLLKLRRHFKKPDIILHNIHAPFDYLVGTCARKLQAKYIVEAWDLWPDSFVRFGLITPNNPLVPLAYAIERKMYERADRIIFSFEGGKDYLIGRKWDKANGGKIDLSKVYYINNGVDVKEFNENKNRYIIEDFDLKDKKLFKVIYLGSIRLVNDVKQIIDAACLLQAHSNIKFLLYGDGADRIMLEEYCLKKKITNVVFKQKWIPLKNVPYVLSCSSLNLLNYEKNFGIFGISSGKFFQYLASGKPICCNINVAYCQITKYNLGIASRLDTPQKYADAILALSKLSNEKYKEMCDRVKDTANLFDFKLLSNKLLEVIKTV